MHIIIANGLIVPFHTIIILTEADLNMPDRKRQCIIFNNLTRKKHGDFLHLPPWVVEAGKKKELIDFFFILYKDDKEEPRLILENDFIDLHISLVNASVNAKVLLLKGEESEE